MPPVTVCCPPRSGGINIWLNPAAMLAAGQLRYTDYVVGNNEWTQVAVVDPKRIMIGFWMQVNNSGMIRVTPTDHNDVGFANMDTVDKYQQFTLFDFGPLVNEPWFAFSSSGTPLQLRVYEVIMAPP